MTESITRANPEIRNLRLNDKPDIVRIDGIASGATRETYFDRKFDRIFSEESHLLLSLVAVVDGKIIGYIMGESNTGEYGIPEEVASVDTIGVDPEYRRLGVGAMLLDEYCSMAAKAGISKMTTLVTVSDEDLIDFFQSHSFGEARMVALEKALSSE